MLKQKSESRNKRSKSWNSKRKTSKWLKKALNRKSRKRRWKKKCKMIRYLQPWNRSWYSCNTASQYLTLWLLIYNLPKMRLISRLLWNRLQIKIRFNETICWALSQSHFLQYSLLIYQLIYFQTFWIFLKSVIKLGFLQTKTLSNNFAHNS